MIRYLLVNVKAPNFYTLTQNHMNILSFRTLRRPAISNSISLVCLKHINKINILSHSVFHINTNISKCLICINIFCSLESVYNRSDGNIKIVRVFNTLITIMFYGIYSVPIIIIFLILSTAILCIYVSSLSQLESKQ